MPVTTGFSWFQWKHSSHWAGKQKQWRNRAKKAREGVKRKSYSKRSKKPASETCSLANWLLLLRLLNTCATYFSFRLHDSWSRWVTGVGERMGLTWGGGSCGGRGWYTSCLKVKSYICFFFLFFSAQHMLTVTYTLCIVSVCADISIWTVTKNITDVCFPVTHMQTQYGKNSVSF